MYISAGKEHCTLKIHVFSDMKFLKGSEELRDSKVRAAATALSARVDKDNVQVRTDVVHICKEHPITCFQIILSSSSALEIYREFRRVVDVTVPDVRGHLFGDDHPVLTFPHI